MLPFQALYDVPSPSIHTYIPKTIVVHFVDATLQGQDKLLRLLRANLQLDQNRMKQIYDNERT